MMHCGRTFLPPSLLYQHIQLLYMDEITWQGVSLWPPGENKLLSLESRCRQKENLNIMDWKSLLYHIKATQIIRDRTLLHTPWKRAGLFPQSLDACPWILFWKLRGRIICTSHQQVDGKIHRTLICTTSSLAAIQVPQSCYIVYLLAVCVYPG